MTESPRCAQCGHALGAGPYCRGCGAPVQEQWRTDTAERPPVPPTVVSGPGVPPPAFEPPPRARYPLFADEAGTPGDPGDSVDPVDPVDPGDPGSPWSSPPTVPVPVHQPPPPPQPPPSSPFPPAGPPTSHRRRRGVLPWLVATAAVVLLAVVGALLLFGGGEDDDTARDPGSSVSRSPGASPPTSTEPPPTTPEPSPAEPSTPAGPVQDLTGEASISAPVTAPPSTEVDGDPVTYNADNMLDGVPATAWRMPGDGSGTEIRIDFGRPVQLERVGLVNGYAKRDPGYDGYTANRRITRVVWRFDDGSEQAQLLDEVRRLQVLDVGPVTTSAITLRIVSVTRPGSRDFTAISDVALTGRAG